MYLRLYIQEQVVLATIVLIEDLGLYLITQRVKLGAVNDRNKFKIL